MGERAGGPAELGLRGGRRLQAVRAGLRMSLFERLQRAGHVPCLLDLQYRMHPLIAQFPSAAFYDSKLRSAASPDDRQPPSGSVSSIHTLPPH